MKKEQNCKVTPDLLKPSAARFIVLPIVYLISVTLLHILAWDIIGRIGYNLPAKLTFIFLENILPIAALVFFMLKKFKVKMESKLLLLCESLILVVLPFISFMLSVIFFGLILVMFFGVTA